MTLKYVPQLLAGTPNSPFLPSTNIQFATDSTSIGYLKTCARLYEYTILEGWRSRGESVHLKFGQLYHSGLELYDKLRVGVWDSHYNSEATTYDHDGALYRVVQEALEQTWERKPGEEPDGEYEIWDEKAGHRVPKIGLGHPWLSDHHSKNRETLIRSIIWYLDQFRDDPAATLILANGKPAVELSFRMEMEWGPESEASFSNWEDNKLDARYIRAQIEGDKHTPQGTNDRQNYLLCGHLDRVVEFGGQKYVMDRKAQPLSTKVLGRDGWIKIGDLNIGDEIAGRSGEFVRIKNLFPKGKTKVYKVSFNDRTDVLCAEAHLWTVETQFPRDGWKTKTLLDLIKGPKSKKYAIPLMQPVQHPERELAVHPYLLGALLGNGYFSTSISLSTSHSWLVDNLRPYLGGDLIHKCPSENHTWSITGRNTLYGVRKLGLDQKRSKDKFIPQEYLFASETQRRFLLKGLIETDGSWNGTSMRYQSMSYQLIEDVCSLVRSLGGTARWIIRSDGCYRASIRMENNPTGLGKRYISSIIQVEDDETMCIEVDAHDGLYVTENYIVTHNTTGSSPTPHYFEGFSPDNQMSIYTLASRVQFNTPVAGVIIDAAQVAVGFTRFQRGFTYRTEAQLEEWLADFRFWTAQAEGFAEANHWPMNDRSCGMYGGCTFRKICSKSPEVRERFLESDFERRPWNPLISRG